MLDFDKYFSKKYQFHLKSIDYKMLDRLPSQKKYELSCQDYLKTEVAQNELHIDFVRNMKFTPKGLYTLTVAFGAVFEFNNDIKDEIDFKKIDWDLEVLKNREKFLSNVTARASLLISQITSSYGLVPVITPPTMLQDNNEK
jgi:hypothetical protein